MINLVKGRNDDVANQVECCLLRCQQVSAWQENSWKVGWNPVDQWPVCWRGERGSSNSPTLVAVHDPEHDPDIVGMGMWVESIGCRTRTPNHRSMWDPHAPLHLLDENSSNLSIRV